MALLKNGRIETDPYLDVSTEDSIPENGALIISLTQWQENRDALLNRQEPLGIVLRSDEKPEAIEDDLGRFKVIALDFPAFGDGRAYSHARHLRDRYAYQGELRAVGDVLLEQLHFMHRVGFNSFNIQCKDAASAWKIATADISVWYQPTGDGRTPVMQLRHHE